MFFCGSVKSISIKRNLKRPSDREYRVISEREPEGISEAVAINLPALHHIRRNIQLLRQANQQLTNRANIKDVPELPPRISTILHQ